MTRHRNFGGARYSQGFSLIELMVSLVIGLIISIAAFSAYLGASGAARMAEAQGRMNEDAQAALSILTQQLRMAGNNPEQASRTDESQRNPIYLPTPTFSLPTPTFTFSASPTAFTLSNFTIRGCDGTFSNITTATSIDNLNCASGASTSPDSIAINYEADTFNTLPASGNVPTDCLGNKLTRITAVLPTVTTTTPNITTSTVAYFVADNRFYIGTSTAILSPSLYCKGNGGSGTQQPLVENIENMQFNYGAVKSSTAQNQVNTATVAGYLTADQVLTDPNMAALTSDAARWAKVVTVRICIVVRSELPVASDAASARYFNCDGNPTAVTDLRLRRAYSTTVLLRNRRL